MLAYCGLNCITCPIHLATLETDKSRKLALRESIAKQCAEIYNMEMKAGDITDCDGCMADTGILFSGCMKCPIRKCAQGKNIKNCAYCAGYACEQLMKHFALDPEAKTRLEQIRASGFPD